MELVVWNFDAITPLSIAPVKKISSWKFKLCGMVKPAAAFSAARNKTLVEVEVMLKLCGFMTPPALSYPKKSVVEVGVGVEAVWICDAINHLHEARKRYKPVEV